VQDSRIDRIHKYIVVSASALDHNRGVIERITALLSIRNTRSHATAYKASVGMRIVWNRLKCARSYGIRSIALSVPDFPEIETKLKIAKHYTKN
jgi:hypothetical protein